MKYYLVEKYSPDLKFDEGCTVIALTPLASYELDKTGISYRIIEEFYDGAQFLKEYDSFINEQLDWFNSFDKFLLSLYPEAKTKDFKLATTFYYHIKLTVDSVILRSRILEAFIKKASPKSITYIAMDQRRLINNLGYPEFCILSNFFSSDESQSLFFRLIPIFCKKYNIEFDSMIAKDMEGLNSSMQKPEGLFKGLEKYFKFSNYLKVIFGDIFSGRRNIFRYNLFFLNSGYNNLDIMAEAYLTGCKIFYRAGVDIIKIKRARHDKLINEIKSEITKEPVIRYKESLEKIYHSDVLDWINNHCGIDVRPIILPKLKSFISTFFPQLISLVGKYKTFYDSNQIDMVFTSQRATVEEYAAIVACRFTEKTKSAYLPHGDSAFDSWIDFFEYRSSFDVYFPTNSETEEYTKKRISSVDSSTRVLQNPNRYKAIPRISYSKSKRPKNRKIKTVVFLPTPYLWDLLLWFSSSSEVPDTRYFRWHKEVLHYFSQRTDFNFIWKSLPSANQAYDPIPYLLNDKNYPNIRYATEPFVRWIKKADMVLLDYPSTALYEAAISGLPVMSLYFAPLNKVRRSALDVFGKSLQPFNDFDEGIEKIDGFLDADPKSFVVNIPISGQPIIEAIDLLISKREGEDKE
ncbi:hypothetical protein ACFL1K_00115 [Candidatus Omnitrophota bacterium]